MRNVLIHLCVYSREERESDDNSGHSSLAYLFDDSPRSGSDSDSPFDEDGLVVFRRRNATVNRVYPSLRDCRITYLI